MSPAEDKDLSPAAARLARAAPREWAEFKTAYRKYADAQRDLLVRAPLEELQRVQGRAQQCSAEIALYDDAVNAADRISARTVARN